MARSPDAHGELGSFTQRSAYDLRRLYGDWLVGFREVPCFDAWLCTAAGVRPSFRAATRVGVFCFASLLSCWRSPGVQGFPEFRFDLAMQLNLGRPADVPESPASPGPKGAWRYQRRLRRLAGVALGHSLVAATLLIDTLPYAGRVVLGLDLPSDQPFVLRRGAGRPGGTDETSASTPAARPLSCSCASASVTWRSWSTTRAGVRAPTAARTAMG